MAAAMPASASLDCLLGGIGSFSYCTADCNGDGRVTVDEVLAALSIALDAERLASCSRADIDEDDHVAVFEIVAGVNAALHGCRLPAAGYGGGIRFQADGVTGADRTQSTVHLSFWTTADFPCLGYVLPVVSSVSAQTVVVVFGCPFIRPGVCLTALGPATGVASISLQHGSYELQLHSQSAIDRYAIEVTSAGVTILPIEIAFSAAIATRTPLATPTETPPPTRLASPSPTPSSNRPPLHARAEAIPATAFSGETVILDGSHSSQGKSFSGYWWRQSKGSPEVMPTFFTSGAEQLQVTAPNVADETLLEFELMVRGLGNGCCGPITEHISSPVRLTVLPAP